MECCWTVSSWSLLLPSRGQGQHKVMLSYFTAQLCLLRLDNWAIAFPLLLYDLLDNWGHFSYSTSFACAGFGYTTEQELVALCHPNIRSNNSSVQ